MDDEITRLALPLNDEADLDPLLARIGDASIVLLGEASHGTHEFYAWRAAITRRLIQEHGFGFVAVEGDWPDCYSVNCSVVGAPGAAEDPRDALAAFDRWPTWMWANDDVVDFARWLRAWNDGRPPSERAGFFGLDVYSLWDSLRRILGYLRAHEPAHVQPAIDAWRCLEPYAEDPQEYARAVRWVPTSCEDSVIGMLREVRRAVGPASDDDARFDAEQNALVASGAETYYRTMVRGGPASWNVRDRHMAATLDRLLEHHRATGRRARAVVWEHNTHIGDARYTDMADAGMVNLGQLAREAHGEDDVVLVGFGTYEGTVLAAPAWDAPVQAMRVPPASTGSVEHRLRASGVGERALFLHQRGREMPQWLREARDHRAIGVVYRPEAEHWGNYVRTVLGRRYDAFCWMEHTTALRPLHGELGGPRETMADLRSAV